MTMGKLNGCGNSGIRYSSSNMRKPNDTHMFFLLSFAVLGPIWYDIYISLPPPPLSTTLLLDFFANEIFQ